MASKKKPIVTVLSTEAEYVAATLVACQEVWLRRVLYRLKKKQQGPTSQYYDTT